MRAQLVALCLFPFSAKYKFPTALLLHSASLLWQSPTCQSLLRSQRDTDVPLDMCQFGHKVRRLTRVLLANVELCDAEKLRRTCRGVDFVCSRSGTDAIPGRLPAEFCHSLVQTLTPGPPCFRTTIAPFQPAHEKVTFGMIWSDGAFFF